MRSGFRPTWLFCLAIVLFFSFGTLEAQNLETEKNFLSVDDVSPPSVPDDIGSQKPGFPLFAEVVVEDNPDDDGRAIRVRWLITESTPAKRFSKEQSPDYGTFGYWNITKSEKTVQSCKEGKKKKSETKDISDYSAKLVSGKNLFVVIFRADAFKGKATSSFRKIGKVPAGNILEKEEFRFNRDSRNIYVPSEKLRYDTPGVRMYRNRFWQSFIDHTVEYGKEYLYRVLMADGTETAYCYRSIPEESSENRDLYELSVDFGPVSAGLNAIPSDKNGFDSLREKYAVSISPPQRVNAKDNPSDSGDAVFIEWLPSEQDVDVMDRTREEKLAQPNSVLGYRLYRSEIINGEHSPYEEIGRTGAGLSTVEREDQKFKDVKLKWFVDIEAPTKLWDDEACAWYKPTYSYIVAAWTKDGFAFSTPSGGSSSQIQWFDRKRTMFLVLAVTISLAILWFIQSIKSGKKLFIRKIAGLDAIDEAIGRATEMGRPILFIPGIQDLIDVQTVSGVIILGRIAKTIAEYDTKLMVPTARSLVMTTAREIVKEAYLSAGRPDAYNDDMITYLTDEQFGYVAGVNGIMVREKPATCFYMGTFYAESLILAETGNFIGSIQIAGTAMPAQLPFFIAACDYTLIGEELFAASAYLSHDAKQLGSLKGQDVGKVIAMLAILAGVTLATISELTGTTTMLKIFEFVRNLFQVA